MTDIIKKFKFDLSMGRFKPYYSNDRFESVIFECDSLHELRVFMIFLKQNDFIDVSLTDINYLTSETTAKYIDLGWKPMIKLSVGDLKTFSIDFGMNKDHVNELPDYIKELAKQCWLMIKF